MAYCGDCVHLDVCKTADSCCGSVPRCKHFMDKKVAAQITKCAKCKDQSGTLFDALESIIHYDGHYEWLKKMRDDMETHKGEGNYFREFEEWHSEEHTIWMLLVGMFGEWGTSIRSGWIQKEEINECIEFIDSVCELAMEAAERNAELEVDDGCGSRSGNEKQTGIGGGGSTGSAGGASGEDGRRSDVMVDKEIEFLRSLGVCADKEQAHRLIEEYKRADAILADIESTRIINGVVRTPRILALVLFLDEVQVLINDTMFYMEHLQIREGMCIQREFGLRNHLLQKLQAFERQLSGTVEEYYDT